MTFQDVKILVKLVFNNDENNYYFNIFLEKASDELIDVSEGIDVDKTSQSKRQ